MPRQFTENQIKEIIYYTLMWIKMAKKHLF